MAELVAFEVSYDGTFLPALAEGVDRPIIVVLGHGAGSHKVHKTMQRIADVVAGAGAGVVRFDFPYRAAGRSIPDRMPVLIGSYQAVLEEVRKRWDPPILVVGGHSMGGRVASMMEAQASHADGLLLFGYPLHPPGQFAKLRDAHLASIRTRTLQLNGTQDELCDKTLMDAVAAKLDPSTYRLHWLDGADHSYHVKRASGRTAADIDAEIHDTIKSWFTELQRSRSSPTVPLGNVQT